MLTYAFVAVGGALGSALRYGMNIWITAVLGEALPWGTILINIAGSFVIGLSAALFASGPGASIPVDFRQFVLAGVCGGFTTFSSFSLQTFTLLDSGEPGRALLNVALSVTLCLLAVAAGYAIPSASMVVRHG